MPFTRQELSEVFRKSGGRCHVCGKALVFAKYGHFGRLGEWELDHVKPTPEDGFPSVDSVFPACILCNRHKPSCRRSAETSSLA